MNLWECDAPGCGRSVIGVGSAIGLRAIGWWFTPGWNMSGPRIRCPVHRPDPVPCVDKYTPEDERRASCTLCAAEAEAAKWQNAMGLQELLKG